MYAMKRNILLLGLIYIAISCSDSRVYTVYTPDVVDTLRMDSVALSEELVMPTRSYEKTYNLAGVKNAFY